MNRQLDGKITIVTGGLSGIGEAIARRMAEEGATVIAADLASQKSTLASGTLSELHMDVADPVSVDSALRQVLAQHGRLDCLINSAGIGKDVAFLETTLEMFDQLVAINLRGSFILGQATARAMRDAGGGSIVNIASVSGIIGNAGRSAYGAAKGGVVSLSRVMAIDLAPFRVRVNVLAPGPVETPLVQAMHPPAKRSQWIDHTPMHRYARPEELAGAAVFLCSDDATFITGHVLVVDGGFLAAGITASDECSEPGQIPAVNDRFS